MSMANFSKFNLENEEKVDLELEVAAIEELQKLKVFGYAILCPKCNRQGKKSLFSLYPRLTRGQSVLTWC